MREGKFTFGGENSGHLIFSDFATTGDGIVSALIVLSIIKNSGKTLSELADCMTEYPAELVAIPVIDKPPLDTVPEIKTAMIDAETALGDEGRILVRYSGTEKKLRILVEAKNADLAKTHCDKITQATQATIGA